MSARHLVVGTAGHVDHGKTALVQALTGTDTDRWQEEKRRGITIDLGFAFLDLGDGLQASIVDVPGHEDFVRNMVAGATGIDVALLVVAADEGVMPQTREHLEILRFLGIRHGVIAVTKADLVEEDWLELVLDDVVSTARDTTAGGVIDWADPVAVSSLAGTGLDDLRSTLRRVAARVQAGDPTDLFRMPVDRSFSVAGAGTVVTGTTWSGTATVGDDVMILPGEQTARVRSIEVHDQAAEQAVPGRRTALALVGVDRDAVGRGSFVVHPGEWVASRRVDAFVTLLPTARALTQRSRIRVHVGTAEIMARVTPAGDDIQPGESGVVRLRLDEPLVCRWGDRGVLRAYSPMITVGGMVVFDPSPDPRPRRPSPDQRLRSDAAVERLAALTNLRGTIPVSALPVRLGVHPDAMDEVLSGAADQDVSRSGATLISAAAAQQGEAAALAMVEQFHRENPLKPGLPLEEFRRAAGTGLADQVRATLEENGTIIVDRGRVRMAGHTAVLSAADQAVSEALTAQMADVGAEGVTFAEFTGDARDRHQFTEVAEFLVRSGDVLRIGSDRYYAQDRLRAAVRQVVDHLGENGQAGPPEFRELLGLSRKYLIPLLEWMDGQGITVRDGDSRRKGPQAGDWV